MTGVEGSPSLFLGGLYEAHHSDFDGFVFIGGAGL